MLISQFGDILTIDDVCEILKIGRGQCYGLLQTGRLKAFKMGKTWKIPKEAVIEFIKMRGYKSATKTV